MKDSFLEEAKILEKLRSKISNIDELTTNAEDNNSVVGHVWSWMKNNIPLLDKITDSSPWIQNNKLNCWCEFTRNEFQIQNYYLWSSIQNPTIQGLGYGSVYLGFEGIKEAAKDAVKQAVREHYRTLIKNKPQEITGSVLIKKMPTMGIDAGRYMIKLDFFLEYGRIKEYTEY